MVIDLPLVNDDLTNCDRYAQGLMGRCCGYGKKEHSVKVISSLRHASHYSHWYRLGYAPARPSAKTVRTKRGIETKLSSAYDKIGFCLDAKLGEDDDEEPADDEDPAEDAKLCTALQYAHMDEDYATDSGDDVVVKLGVDEDYASDSGDDVVQQSDDEFYDSLVIDWTTRSATIDASLKPVSDATIAIATQMMADVLEWSGSDPWRDATFR
jgi:hypothetical protein